MERDSHVDYTARGMGSSFWRPDDGENRCVGKTQGKYRKSTECAYVGNLEHDGKFYCRLHWPPAVHERSVKMRATLIRHLADRVKYISRGLMVAEDLVLREVVEGVQEILCFPISKSDGEKQPYRGKGRNDAR